MHKTTSILLIALTLLLASTICSCGSSRTASCEYKDTVSLKVDKIQQSVTAEELLSLLVTTTQTDLSGIHIEFFQPDSANPHARAAPKSIDIQQACTKETSEAKSERHTDSVSGETVNLSAQSSSAKREDIHNDTNILTPSSSFKWLSLIGILLIVLIIVKCRSPSR